MISIRRSRCSASWHVLLADEVVPAKGRLTAKTISDQLNTILRGLSLTGRDRFASVKSRGGADPARASLEFGSRRVPAGEVHRRPHKTPTLIRFQILGIAASGRQRRWLDLGFDRQKSSSPCRTTIWYSLPAFNRRRPRSRSETPSRRVPSTCHRPVRRSRRPGPGVRTDTARERER